MTNIEWRKIPRIPDRYEVSNTGLVRALPADITTISQKTGRASKRRLPGRYLTPYVREDGKSRGHPVVSLSSASKDVNLGVVRVALLVARAFHGTPYEPGDSGEANRWRIRHKDGDILNVRADNLEWIGNAGAGADQKANDLYAYNLRRLEELRQEPVEDWIKRIWGEDAQIVA